MGASYRSKQAHLQITCTPTEYLRHLKDLPYGRRETTVILPQYLISRCPFCKRERSAPVDTHSIYSWNNPSGSDSGHYFAHYSTVKKAYHDQPGCKHFSRVQRFLNLEGTVPVEQSSFDDVYHVPFVMPFYLPDDQPSAAVIHSLPVCRIESADGLVFQQNLMRFVPPVHEIRRDLERKFSPLDLRDLDAISDEDRERLTSARFVPRYTAFAVSYYAQNPKPLIEKLKGERASDHWVVMLADMQEMAKFYPEGYRLRHWVEQGKLYWLDLDAPDLPLKDGPVEDFPYDAEFFDVTGSLREYQYQHGEFTWW